MEKTLTEFEHMAFVFPGQGSQFVGMGRDCYDQYPEVQELYHTAENELGYDLQDICFNGPEDKLKQTRYTQPALFIHSYVIFLLMHQKGIRPVALAGHSLGELTALACAGAYSFENGLKLVQDRARLMQEAADLNPGTMAAVIGLSNDDVSSVCLEAGRTGIVVSANFNSPEQTVISGSKEGVAKAGEIAKSKGAKRVIELAVSGAFHSPLMREAGNRFKAILDKAPFRDAAIPVYANVTALPTTQAFKIRDNLVEQLTHAVRWVETIRNMVRDGITSFVEIGPGKVLSGLVKRIEPDIPIRTCGTVDELNAILG
jgi:[acyl-carrier-protein] S-malonyltransferase